MKPDDLKFFFEEIHKYTTPEAETSAQNTEKPSERDLAMRGESAKNLLQGI